MRRLAPAPVGRLTRALETPAQLTRLLSPSRSSGPAHHKAPPTGKVRRLRGLMKEREASRLALALLTVTPPLLPPPLRLVRQETRSRTRPGLPSGGPPPCPAVVAPRPTPPRRPTPFSRARPPALTPSPRPPLAHDSFPHAPRQPPSRLTPNTLTPHVSERSRLKSASYLASSSSPAFHLPARNASRSLAAVPPPVDASTSFTSSPSHRLTTSHDAQEPVHAPRSPRLCPPSSSDGHLHHLFLLPPARADPPAGLGPDARRADERPDDGQGLQRPVHQPDVRGGHRTRRRHQRRQEAEEGRPRLLPQEGQQRVSPSCPSSTARDGC